MRGRPRLRSTPKVGRRRILTRLNDPTPYGARVRKQLEKFFPVTEPYRALKFCQILRKAPEHLQNCPFIIQEYIPPHGRIGRGDAREITEPAGRKLDYFRIRDSLQVLSGVDDVVSNQVW